MSLKEGDYHMTKLSSVEHLELTNDDLDQVTGGIILVSGWQQQILFGRPGSFLDRVALNPQPLPPKTLFH
jgi:hypothetical protein